MAAQLAQQKRHGNFTPPVVVHGLNLGKLQNDRVCSSDRGRRPWRLWQATTQDSSNGLGAGRHLDPAHGATTHSAFAHVSLAHMSE